MKKTFIFALTIVLTASLLTACRSKAPEETDSPTNSTNDTAPSILPSEMMPDMDITGDSGVMDGTGNEKARGNRRNIPFD
jgi:hypothetical protein